jgi:sugar O-acyltransferase (sialic acid O-acetyltransferase NeuD family)
MPDLMIFGGPAGGTVIAHSIKRLAECGGPIRLAGFLNDELPVGETLAGARVVARFDAWRELPDQVVFAAPLHKAKHMQSRAQRIRQLGVPDARWATIVDPSAAIDDDAEIGCGSFAGPFAVVDGGVRLGRHVALWPAAQIAHHSVVEDYVFAGRGSIVSGRCRVGLGAHVGPGAVIVENLRVGRFAVIGAGAVVIRDVPHYAIVAGNPARIIGHVEPADEASSQSTRPMTRS